MAVLLLVTSCGDSDSDGSATATTGSTETSAATAGLDTGLFLDGALAKNPTTEDCTLSGGAESTCYSLTVAGYPTDHEVGPFCPDTITDGADKGGIWFDGKAVYDLDGGFIKGLAETYGDDGWKHVRRRRQRAGHRHPGGLRGRRSARTWPPSTRTTASRGGWSG